MLEDFFTKRLQGALFVHMWEKVWICPWVQVHIHRSVLEDWTKKWTDGGSIKLTKSSMGTQD